MQAIHHQIPLLVRTIGSSPYLLDIISDPPIGSEGLLMQVLPMYMFLAKLAYEEISVRCS